jgi:hypothetical protein
MGMTSAPLSTLLYISHSMLYMPDDEMLVADMLKAARARNRYLGISGALIFTHRHFVQYIEGEEVALADLMASIRRDPRHSDVRMLHFGSAASRRFADWSMAYAGPSVFVSRQVEELLSASTDEELEAQAETIITMMEELGSLDHWRKVA